MNTSKVAIAATALASLGLVSVASAGSKANLTVLINTSPVYSAQGSLGSARASADTVQFIGCTIVTEAYSGAPVTTGSCSATNAAGTSVSCSTTDPEIIATIATVGINSFIRFTSNTNGGECTSIRVVNSSQWQPLAP